MIDLSTVSTEELRNELWRRTTQPRCTGEWELVSHQPCTQAEAEALLRRHVPGMREGLECEQHRSVWRFRRITRNMYEVADVPDARVTVHADGTVEVVRAG